MKPTNFETVWNEAHEAGMAAVDKALVNLKPMFVSWDATEYSPGGMEYVADGVCGFAWVMVKPANSKFANWLKKQKKARTWTSGGAAVWVSDFNQSMQKKEAYAQAMAAVFKAHGINAYADSRMD